MNGIPGNPSYPPSVLSVRILDGTEGDMARGNGHSLSHVLVLKIIERDKNVCKWCGKIGTFIYRYDKPCVIENPGGIELPGMGSYNGNDVIPFEIDHVVPVFYGGTDDKSNLTLSCRKCNRAKGVKSYGQAAETDS